MSFPSQSAPNLREQFPARLTRRGFPDFDFVELFSAPPDFEQAEEWIRQLIEDGDGGRRSGAVPGAGNRR